MGDKWGHLTDRLTQSERETCGEEGLQEPLLHAYGRTTVDADEVKLSFCNGNSNLVHQQPRPRGSSFLQALINAINVLAGVGIVSTPYAVAQGGWLGLVFLLAFAAMCCYTGLLLRRCLDTDASLESYPDIGNAAFGKAGKWTVATLLYIDLFLVAVEFLILEGDHLAELFPIANISLGPITVEPRVSFVLIAALIMLPTVWLRDLSSLAYVSAGGAFACLAIVIAVAWVGAFDGVGFQHKGPLLNLRGLPVAVGVYAFCYCGHAVFPNIYKSMEIRSKFNRVLVISFAVCTFLYGAIAIIGYRMFGQDTESQVTLNLPQQFLASKVAVWITLVNPFAKYALALLPIARALEELVPHGSTEKSQGYFLCGTALRTLLVACTVTFALTVPVFGYLMAFIGSFLSINTAVIIPCVCYLKMCGRHVSTWELLLISFMLCLGVVAAVSGTYSSVLGILDTL